MQTLVEVFLSSFSTLAGTPTPAAAPQTKRSAGDQQRNVREARREEESETDITLMSYSGRFRGRLGNGRGRDDKEASLAIGDNG